jgi:hypothetical protein
MMYRIVVSWEHDEVVDLSNSKFFIVQLIGIGNSILNAFFFFYLSLEIKQKKLANVRRIILEEDLNNFKDGTFMNFFLDSSTLLLVHPLQSFTDKSSTVLIIFACRNCYICS